METEGPLNFGPCRYHGTCKIWRGGGAKNQFITEYKETLIQGQQGNIFWPVTAKYRNQFHHIYIHKDIDICYKDPTSPAMFVLSCTGWYER